MTLRQAQGPGHRSIKLVYENCTSCMICVRECPTWCIALGSHAEPIPGSPPGPRQRTHNILDAFSIDWSLCMYCGICIEECPFDALVWSDDLPAPAASATGLVEEMVERP
ncbi:MAG TPA: 4Fe-4S binding protein [Propionibacterium sp.]|nr:4Fe-4S binding protein [Propionibacterium sp.]